MGLYFSSLKDKEVINIRDGSALGFVSDLELNGVTGQVTKLVLPGEGIAGFFSAKKRLYIPWDCVERIGDDVILVRLAELSAGQKRC